MSFGDELGRFQVNAINATEKTVRGTAIALWRAVILDSPVDTGRFRGNWFASQNRPAEITTTFTDKSGASAVQRAARFVSGAQNWQDLWLSNNLPYAVRLEYGYSDQAPKGMVRTNIARFNGILSGEAKKN